MNGTIGNAIIRLTFPNNRILPLSLEKRPLRTFVHLFEDSIERLWSRGFGRSDQYTKCMDFFRLAKPANYLCCNIQFLFQKSGQDIF